jgi:hypothetical protein
MHSPAPGVAVAVGVFVGTAVFVAVGVFVGTEDVFVGDGVFVAGASDVFVAVGVFVAGTSDVFVAVGVFVAGTSDVLVAVGVLVGVFVGVSVATGTSDVLVAVGVLVAVFVGVSVATGTSDVFVAVGVLVAGAVVLVAVGVFVAGAVVFVAVGVFVAGAVVFVAVGVFVAAEPIAIVASKHGSVSDSRPQSTYGVPKESPTETDWMRIRPSAPFVVLYVIDATGRNVPSASAVVVPVDSKHDRNELATLADASLSLLGAGGEQAHVPSAPTVASRKFGFAFLSASVPTGGLSMVCGVAIASKLKAPMSVSNPRLLPMTTFTVTVVVPDGNVQASWMPAVTVSQSMAM